MNVSCLPGETEGAALVTSYCYPHLYFLAMTGAASIVDDLDKRIMVILRDGRHLIGILRSFDQFMNLILEETFERIVVRGTFLKSQCWFSFNDVYLALSTSSNILI